MEALLSKLLAYMASKGYIVSIIPDAVNIVYIEGVDDNWNPNPDRIDDWNDRAIVFTYDAEGNPSVLCNHVCTTEPGLVSTQAPRVSAGVARIPFGQFFVWQMGFHHFATLGQRHPALVQRAPLKVHRDGNRDGKRTGDALDWATGINQHSTHGGRPPEKVGRYSEGCLVRRFWHDQLQFIALCQKDPRYLADSAYLFCSTVIDGDDFGRFQAKR